MDDHNISYADLIRVIRNLRFDDGAFYFFCSACELGKIELCQACLDAGIDINVVEKSSGNTLIMKTIMENKLTVNVAEWLIKNGIDVNVMDEDGFSALSFACYNGNFELANLLLENGAKIANFDFSESDLILSVVYGKNCKIVELLLSTGYYQNKELELEISFFKAIELGLTEIVKAFLIYGVSSNMVYYGVPVLHTAVENRSIEIVKLLLENGADVNAIRKDVDGTYNGWYTSIDIVNETEPIYQVLLEYGGKATTKTQKEQFKNMIHNGLAYIAYAEIKKILDQE